MSVDIHHGDCLDVMARLAGECVRVDSIVTDPPYHLTSIVKRFGADNAAPAKVGKTGAYARASAGFMGKKWDGGDVAFWPETWRLAYDVLKPGGHLIAFGGTRTYHRLACAIEDAGFEIRDQLQWLFGSGFPKSRDQAKAIDKHFGVEGETVPTGGEVRRIRPGADQHKDGSWEKLADRTYQPGQYVPATPEAAEWQGWGTALKPASEPIVLARKPLSEGSVAANVLRHGCGALNIDTCRVSSSTGQRLNGDDIWAKEASLCSSCASHADKKTKHGTPATKGSSATSDAVPTLSEKGETSPPDTDKTDIGCSDGMRAGDTAISSNIAGNGKTPTEQSRPATLSTKSMKTSPTTALRICNSCGAEITAHTTAENISAEKKNLLPEGNRPVPTGRGGEQSADKRYTENGSTNFAATPGPRGGAPTGRWPANIVHDGSDEVLEAFAAYGERVVGKGSVKQSSAAENSGNQGPAYGAESRPAGTVMVEHHDTGTAARFFASFPEKAYRFHYSSKADAGDRLGSKHPTVKPVDLMRWLVRLVTPPGGTVLDPFAGTGTTGMACMAESFNAILIEREAEYVADIKNRIAHVSGHNTPLFAEVAP